MRGVPEDKFKFEKGDKVEVTAGRLFQVLGVVTGRCQHTNSPEIREYHVRILDPMYRNKEVWFFEYNLKKYI